MSKINGLIGRRNLLRVAGIGGFGFGASMWALQQSIKLARAIANFNSTNSTR
ncbi:hypothetical protein [Nostoc sp.]